MGNAINKESNDTINWNNVNTDEFSDSFDKKLNGDANLLITRLNIPSVESDTVSDIENIFSKYQTVINNTSVPKENSSELSDTSPFISSEMYNFLINKSSPKKQSGGALKMEDDDSSTSSTSSSSETLNKKKSTVKQKNNKPSKNSDLEYVSSSAHTDDTTKTGGSNSNEDEESSNENTTKTGGSISNNNEDVPPSSINTSDINMITESS